MEQETEEQVLTRHKKELKSLEGEKRASLKKIKGTKGKKGKELQAQTETEFETKLKDLKLKHEEELNALKGSNDTEKDDTTTPETTTATTPSTTTTTTVVEPDTTSFLSEKERKLEKARLKKQKKKQKEQERQKQIEQERLEAGPDERQVEISQLVDFNQFEKKQLQIGEIASDGHCLYRSIAAQVLGSSERYMEIRHKCAQGLMEHQEELEPFVEYTTDAVQTYEQYVENVKSSSDWGGHLELRALHSVLDIPIIVYRGMGLEPLILGTYTEGQEDDSPKETNVIRLSYHMHYYALGEHYNQVISIKAEKDANQEE